jgi:hypothetical protein
VKSITFNSAPRVVRVAQHAVQLFIVKAEQYATCKQCAGLGAVNAAGCEQNRPLQRMQISLSEWRRIVIEPQAMLVAMVQARLPPSKCVAGFTHIFIFTTAIPTPSSRAALAIYDNTLGSTPQHLPRPPLPPLLHRGYVIF